MTADTQKARVAYMMASSYFLDDDMEEAMCLWNDRAIGTDPTNELYRQFKRDYCNQ